MSHKDLHSFIEELEKLGELKRIRTEVSSELEITEIADRVSKAHGPALLFEQVNGSKYPLLINAMGSYNRMSKGLGAKELDELGALIAEYLNFGNYLSVKKLIKSTPRLLRLLYALPSKSGRKGKCQEVIEREVDLDTLPVLKCWPEDAGKFVTLPLVFTKDINTRRQNVGMYRLQLLDKTSTGMHWHKHKDGSEIYKGYQERGQRMPVSVALGCDPAITYASTAPMPPMLDEMMLAGWLRKSRVRMVKCITNDIYVPANAEFVLEGYVDPKEELVLEGPFGDHTGYYSLADYYPRFHVTCITHRKDAIYPATVVGKPPMEDCYMAKATERIFLPMLRMIIPELVDMNLPLEGVFHNCAIVSIKAHYPGAAIKAMNAIWGMGQMMYTKLIVVVDAAVDVQDIKQVRDAVLTQVDADTSLIISEGPLDALDHSSNEALYGNRLGMDATGKRKAQKTSPLTNTYQIITLCKEHPGQAKEVLSEYMNRHSDKFVIAVDQEVNPEDLSTVMWKVFNNIDAKRDFVIIDGKIGIDATKKWKEEGLTREWPKDIMMTQEMKQLVNERWRHYDISESYTKS
ncbi:menaquinone biosynthesis decarboxylase [Anaerocolumna xylanovorans]|uniref:4-hydroxy-3-polyprenylbenzoate decarboxylase n=1 Tax=Anaerocolumna xylanovorans DSM 12503 TaxID=1121345 RepID=A0A1M7YJR1_9FIRM|nr:menaquinone biosynthesis decarboxylase [Anaerocolumna xylanovorans]SHO52850.1 4-hydroxy-3-polyprenylbenzoate decarboxylase [Anaerocolumna xylanovorans DSM 12503]